MLKMLRALRDWFLCLVRGHQWTMTRGARFKVCKRCGSLEVPEFGGP